MATPTLQDLAALIYGQQAQPAIAQENPFLKYQQVPDSITQLAGQAVQADPQKYGKQAVVTSLISGLLSGAIGGLAERRQKEMTTNYSQVFGDILKGKTPDQSLLPASLFDSANNQASLFKLQQTLKNEDANSELKKVVVGKLADNLTSDNSKVREEAIGKLSKLGISGLESLTTTPTLPLATQPTTPTPDSGIQTLEQKKLEKVQRYQDSGMGMTEALKAAESDLSPEIDANKEALKNLKEDKSKAQKLIEMANSVDSVLDSGFKTGAGTGVGQAIAEYRDYIPFAERLGFDEKRSQQGQLLDSIQSDVVAMKRVPGSTSDYDAKMYVASGASKGKEVATNREISRRMRQLGERGLEYTNLVQDTLGKGGTVTQADDLWAKYEAANPLWVKKDGALIPNESAVPFSKFISGDAVTAPAQSDTPASSSSEAPGPTVLPGLAKAFVNGAKKEDASIFSPLFAKEVVKAGATVGATTADTALLGLPRRALAAGEAVVDQVKDVVGADTGKTFSQHFQERRAEIDGKLKIEQDKMPGVTTVSKVVGAVASPINKIVKPLQGLAAIAKIPAFITRAGFSGSVAGVVSYLESDQSSPTQQAAIASAGSIALDVIAVAGGPIAKVLKMAASSPAISGRLSTLIGSALATHAGKVGTTPQLVLSTKNGIDSFLKSAEIRSVLSIGLGDNNVDSPIATQPIESLQSEKKNSEIVAPAPQPVPSAPGVSTSIMIPQTKRRDVAYVESQIDSNPYYSALYEAESGRNPKAKNPNSSAKGAFQFVDGTARALKLADPYNIGDAFEAVQKLTKQHAKFGTDPATLYSAHYLGAGVMQKLKTGKPLTENEAAQVDYLQKKALPDFLKIYERIVASKSGITNV